MSVESNSNKLKEETISICLSDNFKMQELKVTWKTLCQLSIFD